ncbi:hypothetical protein MM221_07455 [Salipaludibacillus sp. LMS25]|jgi:hypothetical protein|uniref:HEAT repeat domain-containing protein n=1 Tax=Salipaludibacillus sp. LMS25 TaxID=2924031 RepID=UPI0020D0F0D4|nr:hypothetical protein [Salipaludibacillus sp. LMS25]UTR16375.1 hypothetical protein MM221_07455 [Salipaludibacillus sp. LMS25]
MIELILLLTASLFVVQLLLLVYLYTTKAWAIKKDREADRLYQRLFSDFLPYLTGHSDIEPPLPNNDKLKQKVLERILAGFSDIMTDPAGRERIQHLAEAHLASIYRKKLTSNQWSERINALYLIEDFMMDSLREDLKEHLQSCTSIDEEYRQTLRTLASFQEESLLEYMFSHPNMSVGLIKEILRRLSLSLLTDIMAVLKNKEDDIPYAIRQAFIEYCGESGYYEFLPFIESMLTHQFKETRIKALKSLHHYQFCSNPTIIVPFFTSDHWEERLHAAKLTGMMKLVEFSDYLILLAGDRVWWVRFQACEALKKMADGEIILAYLSEQHEDIYAKDMAKQTLTMRAGGQV